MFYSRTGHTAHLACAFAAVLMVLAACGGGKENPYDGPEPGSDPVENTPQNTPLTLSAQAIDGGPVWRIAQSVRVYDAPGSGRIYTRGADGRYSAEGTKASGKGTKASDDLVVLSPAVEAPYNGSYVEVRIPEHQWAMAGEVPDTNAFAVGTSGSPSAVTTLEPVFSGILLSFERDDVYAVTLKATAGESIAGRVRYEPASRKTQIMDTHREVRLETPIGTMSTGKDWVLTMPPVTLSDGFSMTVQTLEGSYEYEFKATLTLARGRFLRIEIPDRLEVPTGDVLNIPDPAFKAFLVNAFDTDGDGEISTAEALDVTSISLSTHEIRSLEGIRHFKNLRSLTANGSRDADRTILGQLTSLDVSGLDRLQTLQCRHNYIAMLNVDGCTSLTSIVCYGNSLTVLDLSGAPALESVDAGDCEITYATVRGHSSLATLYLHNNRLTSLNLSDLPSLRDLRCDQNLITALDLTGCPALEKLDCAPMNDASGQNVLQTVTVFYGMSIANVTSGRSDAYIPSATAIVWAGEKPPVETLGTGLRTMFITTPTGSGIYSKDVWTEGCSVTLVDDEGKVWYDNSAVAVKGRGNSTWNYDKKPYTLKLPEKADLLGTGADKRWNLLANWMDRTLLRNDVALEIARRCTALQWTPSGEFVEVFLNGRHIGNYWLCEKIKTGKARLQADILLEMDVNYDETWRFYSSYGRRVNDNKTGMPINIKEPDEEDMTEAQLTAIKQMVDEVERAIYLGEGDWQQKIGIDSFADWYLVHELTYNGEPNHPKSCFFYFLNGIMYAGPVWDFDWYTFQLGKTELFLPESIYFGRLLKVPAFVSALKSRWAALKPLVADIPSYIDARAAEIRASEALNWKLWPCTNYTVNGDTYLSFDQAVARLKSAFTARITALDSAIAAL